MLLQILDFCHFFGYLHTSGVVDIIVRTSQVIQRLTSFTAVDRLMMHPTPQQPVMRSKHWRALRGAGTLWQRLAECPRSLGNVKQLSFKVRFSAEKLSGSEVI